jgi:hypothetical protein
MPSVTRAGSCSITGPAISSVGIAKAVSTQQRTPSQHLSPGRLPPGEVKFIFEILTVRTFVKAVNGLEVLGNC